MNGKAEEVIVIGVAPIVLKVVQYVPLVHVTVVVERFANVFAPEK